MQHRLTRRGDWLRHVVTLGLIGAVSLNCFAWMHAYAMTHFAPVGQPLTPLATMSLPAKVQMLLTGVTVPRPQNTHTPRDLGLAYEVHRIDLPHGERLEGWFLPHPQARGTVVLFHAYATSKESLLPQAAAFHRLSFATFLVDFRGSGGSSGATTTLGLREAEDVAATVAYVQRTWPNRPLVLYGASMGATAILRAIAAAGVQPDAIILENPFDRLLIVVRSRFSAMPVPASPAAELLLFWGGVQQGFNGFQHNPVDDAAAVTCPTLVLHGGRDPWVSIEETNSILAQVRGPKRLVHIADAGHEVLILAAPRQWNDAVAAFLHQVTTG